MWVHVNMGRSETRKQLRCVGSVCGSASIGQIPLISDLAHHVNNEHTRPHTLAGQYTSQP